MSIIRSTSHVVGGVQHSDNIAFRTSHRLAVKSIVLPPLEPFPTIGLRAIASLCIRKADIFSDREMRSSNSRSWLSCGERPVVAAATASPLVLLPTATLEVPLLALTAVISAIARLKAKFAMLDGRSAWRERE